MPVTDPIADMLTRIRNAVAARHDRVAIPTSKLTVAIARACQEGELPEGCESILIRPAASPGEAFVTLGLPPPEGEPYDPPAAGYRQRAAAAAREQ